MTVPRLAPLARSSTLTILPSVSDAEAVTVVVTPANTLERLAGVVTLTVGAAFAPTVMVAKALVVRLPRVSVATAVMT